MPNYIANKLTIIGTKEQVTEVMNFIKVEKKKEKQKQKNYGLGTIDFNKITPMPRWVYGSDLNIKNVNKKDKEEYMEEDTILIWSMKHWGSKWNAFSQLDKKNSDNTIYFETANNGVPILISKIAWIFPNVVIEYSWIEYSEYSVGYYRFKNTMTIEKYIPQKGTKKAYELVFEITNSTPEEQNLTYNSDIDNYEYIE